MVTEGSLPHSQQPATRPYHEADKSLSCPIPLLEDTVVFYPVDGDGVTLRNVDKLLAEHTVPHPETHPSSKPTHFHQATGFRIRGVIPPLSGTSPFLGA